MSRRIGETLEDWRVRYNEYRRRWRNDPTHRARERTRDRNTHVARQYELSAEDYETLKIIFPSCAICGKTVNGNLQVDHDHGTGEVRGLLCFSCNRGLGDFVDSTVLMRKAILYLAASDPRHLRAALGGVEAHE